MQEFRPASVVEADTEIAAALDVRDVDAVRTLWDRFCAPVHAVAVRSMDETPPQRVGPDTVGTSSPNEVTMSTFVRTIEHIDRFDTSRGFAPLLVDELHQAVGDGGGTPQGAEDVEITWSVARAVESLADDDRNASSAVALRRVEQRVAHLLGDSSPEALLAEPWVWTRPDDDLVDRIIEQLDADRPEFARVPEPVADTDSEVAGSDAAGPRAASSRSVRSAIIGVGGAAAALLGGIVLLSALSGNPRAVDVSGDLVPTGEITGVEGSVEITGYDAGIEIELDVGSLPRRTAEIYRASVLLDDGRVVSAGTFLEGDELTLRAGVRLERAVEFTIALAPTDDDGAAEPSEGRVVFKFDVPAG